MCVRRSHNGMPRLVHLPACGVICLVLVASIAGFWVALYGVGTWYIPPNWYTQDPRYYVAAFVFLVILL